MNETMMNDIMELGELLKCSECKKMASSLKRIATCGHFICTDCLNRNKDLIYCPNCRLNIKNSEFIECSFIKSLIQKIDNYHKLSNPDKERTQITESSNLAEKYTSEHNLNFGPNITDFIKNSSSVLNDKSNSPLKRKSLIVARNTKKSRSIGASTSAVASNHSKSQNSHKRKSDLKHPPLTVLKTNKLGENSLHIHSKRGNIEEVRKLLNEHVDPNLKDNAGWTALHEAVSGNYIDIVKLLIENGADVNAAGYADLKPIEDAIMRNNRAIIDLLITNGAEVPIYSSDGRYIAELTDNVEIKNILVQLHPCGNGSKDKNKEKWIMVSGFDEKIKMKIKHIVINLGGKFVDNYENTITHLIVPVDKEKKSIRTIKYLLCLASGKCIVSIDWIKKCEKALKWIIEDPFIINGTSESNSTVVKQSWMRAQNDAPKLFSGYIFYIKGQFTKTFLNHSQITSLILSADGAIVNSEIQLHNNTDIINVKYRIIIDSTLQAKECRLSDEHKDFLFVSVDWLIDCISQQTISIN